MCKIPVWYVHKTPHSKQLKSSAWRTSAKVWRTFLVHFCTKKRRNFAISSGKSNNKTRKETAVPVQNFTGGVVPGYSKNILFSVSIFVEMRFPIQTPCAQRANARQVARRTALTSCGHARHHKVGDLKTFTVAGKQTLSSVQDWNKKRPTQSWLASDLVFIWRRIFLYGGWVGGWVDWLWEWQPAKMQVTVPVSQFLSGRRTVFVNPLQWWICRVFCLQTNPRGKCIKCKHKSCDQNYRETKISDVVGMILLRTPKSQELEQWPESKGLRTFNEDLFYFQSMIFILK